MQTVLRSSRNKQMDLLRICFATLVLLAHAPELTDGNRSRELLTRLTHSDVTFGSLGVDGFFLLSGFLIVKSWQGDPELINFLRKRILRIVPGYLVAALLSTIVIGVLAPGVPQFFRHLTLRLPETLFLLDIPSTPPVFPGSIAHNVNGSMWTIPYEFRCYLLVALAGVCGIVRRRGVWLATASLLVLIVATNLVYQRPKLHGIYYLLGQPIDLLRLSATFMVGGCFYLYRDSIKFRPVYALAALIAVVSICVVAPSRFEPVLIVFGGYLMFYAAQIPSAWVSRLENFPDISYGIYLYGWPIQCLWIWYRNGSPWVTFVVSTVIAFIFGWLSWHFVERPMLTLKRRATAPLPAP